MRKSIAFKSLLRSPLKTLLTFLLIAAASFALFSRVTDYAITTREAEKAKSFYSGVAALDNSVVMIITDDGEVFYPEPKPWPTDAQLEEFSSLPGVTMTDIRYTTSGLVEDYKRPIHPGSYAANHFIAEGTYEGYEEYDADTAYPKRYLMFEDIKVYAGDIKLDDRIPMKIRLDLYEEATSNYKQPFSQTFFDELKEGGRYLIYGTYSEKTGTAFELDLYDYLPEESIFALDGLGDDYLETEEFSFFKKKIDAINISVVTYDIVYTSNMRAIPFVNERKLIVTQGRPLTAEDTDGCVVSEDFLEMSGLSVGDKIHVKLGDKLSYSGSLGTPYIDEENLPHFNTPAELEIIGAYRDNSDSGNLRFNDYEWCYGPGTVFVSSSLLPIEVPEDNELLMNEFSVFIEDPRDIEAFQEAAEPMVAELGLGLRLSDGGWSGMKDNIETGSLISFLTTVLYVLGAALALFLAVYLYIGRNQNAYAIMRTLGVPGKKAGSSITLPLVMVSVFAMPIGGVTGLFYASYTAAKTLADMSDSSAPEGYVYVLDGALPVGVVVLCLVCELVFISFLTLFFLHRMKNTPPLELLHEEAGRMGAAKRPGISRGHFTEQKPVSEIADTAPIPAGLNIARISDMEQAPAHGKYNAFRQVWAYILRHMRRGVAKTAVSFILTIVLAAGIGTFVLARLTYQDACQEAQVKGRATEFASTSVAELMKSDLVKDVYYYNRFDVRVNGVGVRSAITFTNDLDKYLLNDCKITYAEGYDSSVFEGTGAVCLVEKSLAERLGVGPGDEITMMSENLYSFMPQVYKAEDLEFAIERAGKPYKVVGILETEDKDRGAGIFTVINDPAQRLYGQPFPIGYCEFTLTDNGKIMELSSLLEELKDEGVQYVGGLGSYHIDSELLKNAERIRDLLDSLFPIAVAAAVLIGLFGPGLVIMQLAQEAAFLRILGVTKKRARCMLVFEQVILCIVGIVLVAGILMLCSPGQFVRSMETLAFCWALYFLSGVCGAFAAAVQVTRHRILELLQVKE